MMKKLLIPFAGMIFLAACNSNTPNAGGTTAPESAPPIIGFSVVNTFPHDTGFYTEGLEFHDGQLYESSGAGSVKPEK